MSSIAMSRGRPVRDRGPWPPDRTRAATRAGPTSRWWGSSAVSRWRAGTSSARRSAGRCYELSAGACTSDCGRTPISIRSPAIPWTCTRIPSSQPSAPRRTSLRGSPRSSSTRSAVLGVRPPPAESRGARLAESYVARVREAVGDRCDLLLERTASSRRRVRSVSRGGSSASTRSGSRSRSLPRAPSRWRRLRAPRRSRSRPENA